MLRMVCRVARWTARWIAHFSAAFLLLIFVGLIACWIRSQSVSDRLDWLVFETGYGVNTERSGVYFECTPLGRVDNQSIDHAAFPAWSNDDEVFPHLDQGDPYLEQWEFIGVHYAWEPTYGTLGRGAVNGVPDEPWGHYHLLYVPYTHLTAGFAAWPTCWIFLLFRGRRQPGCCRRCGYDLRASSRSCPECGDPIDAQLPTVQ